MGQIFGWIVIQLRKMYQLLWSLLLQHHQEPNFRKGFILRKEFAS